MPNLYVIPGFLSSSLYSDPARTRKVWMDQDQMVLGQEGKLRLAPNGVAPGPPDGVQMYVGGFEPGTWTTALLLLQFQLQGSGYQIVPRPWDWRMSIWDAGQFLAATIRSNNSASNPCAIVAHSAGGLVALAAWIALLTSGDTAKVRRIVTLGTPFMGSYYPVGFLNDTDTGEQTLLLWNRRLGWGLNNPIFYPNYIQIDLDFLCQVACTWPAFYELFPWLGTPDAEDDPNRAALYSARNWPASRGVSQSWLNWSYQSFQPALTLPANQPPSWILTAVAGTGYPTWSQLADPDDLIAPASLVKGQDGDDVVDVTSAKGYAQVTVTIGCQHGSLPFALAARGTLAQLILDPRKAPDPPPPPEVIAEQVAPVIGPAPTWSAIGGGAQSPCQGAACTC